LHIKQHGACRGQAPCWQVYQSKSPDRDHRSGPGDRSCSCGYCLAGNHYQLDGSFNVSVQVHGNVKLTDSAQRAFRQAHFALFQLNASGGHGISDVASTDGTEQLAFLASVGGDGNRQLSQFGSAGFSFALAFSSNLFQLSATRFEGFYVAGGSRSCLTERQQEIASVTSFNGDLVAQVTQIRDLFEQDNFHCDDLFE